MDRLPIEDHFGIIKYSIILNASGSIRQFQVKGGEIIKFITGSSFIFKIYVCRKKKLKLSSDMYYPNRSDRNAIKRISRTLCLMLIGIPDCNKRLMIYKHNAYKTFLIQMKLNDLVQVNRAALNRDRHTICLVKYIGDVPEIGPGIYIGLELFFAENTSFNNNLKLTKKYWNCKNKNGYLINCGGFFTRTTLIDQTVHQDLNCIFRALVGPNSTECSTENEQMTSTTPCPLQNSLTRNSLVSATTSIPTSVSNPVEHSKIIRQVTSKTQAPHSVSSTSTINPLSDVLSTPTAAWNPVFHSRKFEQVTPTAPHLLTRTSIRNYDEYENIPNFVSNSVKHPREVTSKTPNYSPDASTINSLMNEIPGRNIPSAILNHVKHPKEIERVTSSTRFALHRTINSNYTIMNTTNIPTSMLHQSKCLIETPLNCQLKPVGPFEYERMQRQKIEAKIVKKRLCSILCISILIYLCYWGIHRYNGSRKGKTRGEYENVQTSTNAGLEYQHARSVALEGFYMILNILGIYSGYRLIKRFWFTLLCLAALVLLYWGINRYNESQTKELENDYARNMKLFFFPLSILGFYLGYRLVKRFSFIVILICLAACGLAYWHVNRYNESKKMKARLENDQAQALQLFFFTVCILVFLGLLIKRYFYLLFCLCIVIISFYVCKLTILKNSF